MLPVRFFRSPLIASIVVYSCPTLTASPLATPAGKLFPGFYALYAGLVFIVSAALILTPVLHRLLHRFHVTGKS